MYQEHPINIRLIDHAVIRVQYSGRNLLSAKQYRFLRQRASALWDSATVP